MFSFAKSSRCLATWSVAVGLLCMSLPVWAADVEATADRMLATAGVPGGLVVHLGCGDGRLTAALARRGNLVQGLDRDPANVATARATIQQAGVYGQVSADRWIGEGLPYAENLVNLVVSDAGCPVSEEEIQRVLCPGGVSVQLDPDTRNLTPAFFRKPVPDDIDDWTHYLHDASGNAVAADRQVGQPTSVRWIAPPLWERSHEFNPSVNAAVSGGGRLFYTLDEGLAGFPDTPLYRFPERWSLIARDAFNGVLLWKRPIPDWGWRQWNTVGMWSAPLTLQRRLVTDGQRVYFTMGYHAPVTVLDAATGETQQTLADTEGTDEMILSDGVLLLCVREQLSVATPPSDEEQQKQKRRLNPNEWNVGAPGDASLVAIDTATGKVLWQRDPEQIRILTLAAAGGRICYHNSQAIVCLDQDTGRQIWTTPCRPMGGSRHSAGTLVIFEDVVLYTAGDGLVGMSLKTGDVQWTGPKVSGPGISHPADLFVAGGLVWGGDEPGMHDKDRTYVRRDGRDPNTGEVKRSVDVGNLVSPLHHFRCYRSKATDRFLLLTKRGVEYLDLEQEDHMRHDWLRAGCSYGMLPCNGLLYVTPHHCFCYPAAKMNGFLALADKRLQESGRRQGLKSGRVEEWKSDRLERGPAFSAASLQAPASERQLSSWPTYRSTGARSGSLPVAVSAELKPAWEAKLGGRLSQAVIADGRVFVAQVDAHTVHALDASTGEPVWKFTAGGRIDSPPTIYQGLALFGSRDGWVYCVKADTGELAWRYLAAPSDRRVVIFDQVESAWPVPGSVLIQNGVAYVAAGRSTYLDDGIRLCGLDPQTGKLVCENRIAGPWPDVETEVGRPFDMEGVKGDILVGDGSNIYLYQMVFDNKLQQVDAPRLTSLGDRQVGLHLMSTGGLVDYEWYDRTFWTYSRRWPGFYYADKAPKAGQILVFDDTTTYGLHVFTSRARLSPTFTPATDGYELFADDNSNEPILTDATEGREKGPGFDRTAPPKWTQQIPLRVRGLVLAQDKLFMAGEPDVVPDDDPYAAFEGRLGGKLWVVSTANGTRLAEYDLPASTVYDGMSSAEGRLFLSTTNGSLVCWK